MKTLISLTLCVAISACTTAPQVDVKKRWNKALLNYSFVPLYPSRGDVDVGDIRIHRVRKAAAALDSRLIADWRETPLLPTAPKPTIAVLPGIETMQLTKLDLGTFGLRGVIASILGTQLKTSNSLLVSLQDLTTAEIADYKVAKNFRNYLLGHLQGSIGGDESDFVWGVCAAAKAMDDPMLNDTAISIVTRVVKVGKLTYASGSSFSNAPEPGGAAAPQGIKVTSSTGLKIDPVEFDGGISIGVDALMILPTALAENLPERCAAITGEFETSQLPSFKKR